MRRVVAVKGDATRMSRTAFEDIAACALARIALIAFVCGIAFTLCACGDGAKYADGTYTGTGQGQSGDITVTLTISDNVITVDEITDPGEIPGLGGAEAIANGTYKEQIEAAQSSDIAGVESAPLTNEGVIAAVDDALNQAG